MDNKIERIKNLVKELNEASDSYHNDNISIMENREYNTLFDELEELEKSTGIILSNSPTQRAGHTIANSNLPKIKHDIPLLSLGKINDVKEFIKWLGDKEGILMLKIDGGTGKAEYKEHLIDELSTRGGSDTNEGENISHNISSINNIPQRISTPNTTQVTGEMYMEFADFNRLNSKIEDINKKYTHPRNLATATASILDSRICKERNIKFKAFNVIKGMEFKTKVEQFDWLKSQGFDIVEYWIVTKDNLKETIEEIQNNIPNLPYPIDGLVLSFNDLEYGLSLGRTSHHFKHSVSFKFEDSWYQTTYDHTEWNTTRTLQIVPTGVFKTVLIENSKVSRASLSNVSIFENLKLGKDDIIETSKRHLIIPKIENNITRSNTERIPNQCGSCGGEVEIRQDKDTKVLYCLNPNCDAKLSKTIEHFCIKSAMNIENLATSTIEAFLDNGIIKDITDLYRLEEKREEILKIPRFGIPKYNKLVSAIEKSKQTTLVRFLNSLGIPNIGLGTSKDISQYFDNKWSNVENAINEGFDFSNIKDVGSITNDSLYAWYLNEDNKNLVNDLLKYVKFEEEVKMEVKSNISLEGKIFVITGKVELYKNRDELKAVIESLGGKVGSAVSAKTNYLITDNTESGTGKNKMAKQLNIPIINEVQFQEMIGVK